MSPRVQVMVHRTWGLLIFTKLVRLDVSHTPNRYVVEEPEPDNGDTFVDEEDASPPRSGES